MPRLSEDNPPPIEKTAKELAEVLQRDEKEILGILQATPLEIEALRKDPTFCAVMNEISINASYLFEDHRDYLKQTFEPLVTIGLDALKYTPDRRETDESVTAKVARLRAQNLTTRNLFPDLDENYMIGRIRLGICTYWTHIYEEQVPGRILMLLPMREREEFFQETSQTMSPELEQGMEEAFAEIGGAVRTRVEAIGEQELEVLVEMGVHPKIAQRRVDATNQYLLEMESRDVHPSREDLIALAMDEERLRALAKIAIPPVQL